jgi:hypothetical protein
VGINVIDLIRRRFSMLERNLHRPGSPFAIRGRRGHVIGVGGKSVSGELAVNLRAPCLGVLELFDHHHAGAFTHDESIPVAVERPRGLLGIVITRAERFH